MTQYRPIALPASVEPVAIADQPSPMLQWIEVAAMVIDDQYQRPINHGGWRTIKAIAANFRWSCFTPVLLAPIEGGQFAVIDGQHRVHAAMMCGIKAVPAMVVPIAATEQAMAFVIVNTARTAMSQYNLYRAGLASGEEWAIAARDAVAAGGCTLMTFNPSAECRKPGEICSVGLIRSMIKLGHDMAVTVALKALRAVDPSDRTSVLLYTDWILNPLIKAVAVYPALDAETLAEVLGHRRPAIIMDAAERLAKTEHRSTSVVAREMFTASIRAHLVGTVQ